MEHESLPYLLDQGAILVGRDDEMTVARRFLRDVAGSGGGSLVLSGEPGVGKTALLAAVAQAALDEGFQLLFVHGTGFEAEVGFSGLQQLLLPVWSQIEPAPPRYLGALQAALGLRTASSPPIELVAQATAHVLEAVARRRPVIVAADDVHWLDRPTARVLAQIRQRRPTPDAPIGHVATVIGTNGPIDQITVRVNPLNSAASADLLDAAFPGLAGPIRQRILSAAGGNPLALVELGRSLTSGRPDDHDEVPLPLRLLDTFGSRFDMLAGAARRMLLMSALDTDGLHTDGSAAVAELMRPVIEAGIANWTAATGIRFRHPLTARAVVQRATDAELREAHQMIGASYLARPGGLERAAGHLAEAATAPDGQVAGILERAARSAMDRGDTLSATDLLSRAAVLSETDDDRTRRISRAALLAVEVAGNLPAAGEMLAAARDADPDFRTSLAAATATAALLLHADGDIDTAHRLLVSAVESYPHRHDAADAVLVDALTTLTAICWYGGREELWMPYRRALGQLRPAPPALLNLYAETYPDPARITPEVRAALAGQVAGVAAGTHADPAAVVGVAVSASYFDQLSDCRPALDRIVEDGRRGGAAAAAIRARYLIADDDFMTGEWARCRNRALEGLELAESRGYHLMTWFGHYLLARLAAVEGDDDGLADRLVRLEQWAVPRGMRSATMCALHVRTLAAAGRADFRAAYRHAVALSPAGVLAPFTPLAPMIAGDVIEAAMHTGRRAEALAHADALTQARVTDWSPRWELVVAGGRALVSESAADIARLGALTARPESARWPFDRARGRLIVGAHLRRHNAVAESRDFLATAEQEFTRLGAAPWARRAGRELAAAGARRQSPRNAGPIPLTPQQRAIAELAAGGLSNKHIAQRLNISARTVGNHLYRIFPQLGITARSGLRDALQRLED